MDLILRQLRGPRPASLFRKYPILWHGICWNAWYGLGLDHRYVLHPVCCDGDGYEMSHSTIDEVQLTCPS
jgi:hypothetical protein